MKYFGANSLAGFYRSSTSIIEVTTAGTFNNANGLTCSVQIPSGGLEFIESWPFSATGTFWWRFDFQCAGTNSSNGPMLLNGPTPIFRMIRTGGATYKAQYWNGSAYVDTGSPFTVTDSVRATIVFKITLGSGFEVYVGGTLLTSGSGWSGSPPTTATSVRYYSMGSTSVHYYAEHMVADYDLRDSHLGGSPLNGDSAANTSGTGAYTDVNETALDESTAIILAAAGKKGQTHSAFTLASGLGIAGLVLNARGRVSGGVVSQGKLGIRSGGTNYSSSDRGYTSGYEPRGYIIESDPATGAAFTLTGYNNAEPYLEAA
jgi:hypothetical protein